MKRIKKLSVAVIAILTITIASCTKDPDILGVEAKLPTIQLSSLGYQQTGPFTLVTANAVPATATAPATPATIATILQLNFGATTTNTTPGAFKLEISDVTVTTTPVKTVNFTSWSGKDASSTATVTNHTISYTLQPTTYPNTQVYGGTILLKLSALSLTAGRTYSVKATAYNSGGTLSSALTQPSFFKTM
jgi:hypothetical protein